MSTENQNLETVVSETPVVVVPNNTPPSINAFKRNEFGLLSGVDYEFTTEGAVNWRKMIKPEYLVLNSQRQAELEKVYQKPINEISVTEVDDKYLLILLAGIKDLASLRGFNGVTYEVKALTEEFVYAVCRVNWLPNYETEDVPVVFEDGADATVRNTSGFGTNYLTTIAINRAFVRAVRNFLKIYIVGFDEINKTAIHQQEEETQITNVEPTIYLKSLMDKNNISFEKLKNNCLKKGENVDNWESISDIPKIKIFELISRLNKLQEK